MRPPPDVKLSPSFSFRTKLFLAMLFLVLGATGATLYVTQQAVQETYQKQFTDQFDSQIAFFSERQEARLGTSKERCQAVASSVRVRAALEAGDVKDVYDNVFEELGGLHVRRALPVPTAQDAAGPQTKAILDEMFCRVLTGEGEVLEPADMRAGVVSLAAREQLNRRLRLVGRSIERFQNQQVGYLVPEADRNPTLAEVIVTKIRDGATDQVVGAIVLGFPFEVGEQAIPPSGDIFSGIWVEGQLHSSTIQPEWHPEVSRVLREAASDPAPRREGLQIRMDGIPHHVFYKVLNPNSPFPPAYQVCLYSMRGALQTQRDLRFKILGFSGLALAGAFSIIVLVSHGLSVPLRELEAGTAQIQKGNFLVKVPVRSRDEIGRLAVSFNEMAEGLAQKEKYRSLLNMVSDEAVAHELMHGNVRLGGEVRRVSVLFCDIRKFTDLTTGMPPAEIIELLNEHMTALTRVVKAHHGVVDKFVGDLIMAIFGAPLSHGPDALHAAGCARRMVEEREKLNRTSRHHIGMGIGIATGPAVAGCMGSADRLNYTVLGERVNLASRLCSKAGAMQVVIDCATRDLLGADATTEVLPPLILKGFVEPVPAWLLIDVHPRPAQSDPDSQHDRCNHPSLASLPNPEPRTPNPASPGGIR